MTEPTPEAALVETMVKNAFYDLHRGAVDTGNAQSRFKMARDAAIEAMEAEDDDQGYFELTGIVMTTLSLKDWLWSAPMQAEVHAIRSALHIEELMLGFSADDETSLYRSASLSWASAAFAAEMEALQERESQRDTGNAEHAELARGALYRSQWYLARIGRLMEILDDYHAEMDTAYDVLVRIDRISKDTEAISYLRSIEYWYEQCELSSDAEEAQENLEYAKDCLNSLGRCAAGTEWNETEDAEMVANGLVTEMEQRVKELKDEEAE